MRVQATFGLINSTPHTARIGGTSVDAATVRPVLERMAWAGLDRPLIASPGCVTVASTAVSDEGGTWATTLPG